MERCDDRGCLFRPCEVVVADILGRSGIRKREIEAEGGVVEEGLGGMGSLSEPLEFTVDENVAEGTPADG